MEARTGNRVEEKVQAWERTAQKQLKHSPAFKNAGLVDAQLKFHRDMLKTYQGRDDLTDAEKTRLEKMRSQQQQLNRRGQAGGVERWLAGGRNPFTKFFYEFIKGAREMYFQPRRQAAAKTEPVTKAASNRQPTDKQPKQELPKLPKQAILDHVRRSLELHGFGNQLPVAVLKAVEEKAPSFTVSEEMNKGGKRFAYNLQFNRDEDTGRYFPEKLSGALRKTPAIEKAVLAGVNVAELDHKMGRVDWQKDYMDPGIPTHANRREHGQIVAGVNAVFKDLLALLTSNDGNAVKAHDQLVYKHFSGTPAEQAVANMSDIRQADEVRVSADLTFNALKPADLFNIANGGTVKLVNALDETNWYHLEKGTVNGDINVLSVRNAIPGSTEDWLKKQGVVNIPGVQDIAAVAKALEDGESVKATLVVQGITMERFIKADPDGKGIAIDLAASEKEGLYKPEKQNLRESIQQYHEYSRNHPATEDNQVSSQVKAKR